MKITAKLKHFMSCRFPNEFSDNPSKIKELERCYKASFCEINSLSFPVLTWSVEGYLEKILRKV